MFVAPPAPIGIQSAQKNRPKRMPLMDAAMVVVIIVIVIVIRPLVAAALARSSQQCRCSPSESCILCFHPELIQLRRDGSRDEGRSAIEAIRRMKPIEFGSAKTGWPISAENGGQRRMRWANVLIDRLVFRRARPRTRRAHNIGPVGQVKCCVVGLGDLRIGRILQIVRPIVCRPSRPSSSRIERERPSISLARFRSSKEHILILIASFVTILITNERSRKERLEQVARPAQIGWSMLANPLRPATAQSITDSLIGGLRSVQFGAGLARRRPTI